MAQEQDRAAAIRKGWIAILKEAFKIISLNRKIFIQVTAPLMLLLWCLSFACWLIEVRLASYKNAWKIGNWEIATESGISFMLWTMLSSCSVVFTFAYIYSSPKEITFRKVMAAAPRICCRLIHTFVYLFLGFCLYSLLSLAILLLLEIFIWTKKTAVLVLLVLFSVLFIFLQAVVLYIIGAICQLASVVTILEGFSGIDAVKRSLVLLKLNWRDTGAEAAAMCFSVMCFSCLSTVGFYVVAGCCFDRGMEVVRSWGAGRNSITVRIGMEGFYQLMFIMLVCLYLVMSVCIYFVCKDYNLETVDKPLLASLLDSYLEDQEQLSGEVQMEEVVSPV